MNISNKGEQYKPFSGRPGKSSDSVFKVGYFVLAFQFLCPNSVRSLTSLQALDSFLSLTLRVPPPTGLAVGLDGFANPERLDLSSIIEGRASTTPFADYALLGDDILITDTEVARKLNSALLLSRRTYPPRDSWNFCGLRWGKSTKARQIDRLHVVVVLKKMEADHITIIVVTVGGVGGCGGGGEHITARSGSAFLR
ncbi:hypothetical protein KY290_025742 [Solanum tuberosum]|uniref:Uncharacterized protein n=1 Tax=Solanum tuberosum TaxID=4113 RepID=A0ABQ7UUG5_SOLTU|nr:hypothetical protein KY285_024556 [Solanum tuberosum]KAH0755472.1 hypothetical protein KY290_025742 [Solanum tuberosum]